MNNIDYVTVITYFFIAVFLALFWYLTFKYGVIGFKILMNLFA